MTVELAPDPVLTTEALYAGLSPASPDSIVVIDLSGRIIWANQRAADLHGFAHPAELFGAQATDFACPADRVEYAALFSEAATRQHFCNREVRLQRRDGSIFPAQISVSSVRDLNGQPLSFIGLARDVSAVHAAERTAQLQREAALRQSAVQFQALVENIHDVFWMTTPDGTDVLYVSPAYADIWGRSCDSLYAWPQSYLEAVHPDDRAQADTVRQRTLHGENASAEYRVLRPDGSQAWVWERAFPIHDAAGQLLSIAGVAEDITDMKHAQAEMQRALAKEQELSAVKSRFVSMVSHDFRTPLTSILTSADMLESYGHRLSDEKRLHYLNQIQASVKHLKRLLDDVLIIGRAQSGRLEFQPTPIDLPQFCGRLIDELRLNTAAGWAFDLGLDTALPPAVMDEKLLRQILDNLLSNAIKYSPAGGRIGLAVERQGDMAVFRVSDQGLGIPAEEHGRLFDSFYRASNVGRVPGHGLGLAIVKHSVDVHHGTIAFSSQVGAGTAFEVKLPLYPPSDGSHSETLAN